MQKNILKPNSLLPLSSGMYHPGVGGKIDFHKLFSSPLPQFIIDFVKVIFSLKTPP